MCPTPAKIKFGTLRGAAEHMIWAYETYGEWSRPYRCDCDYYHLSTKDLAGEPVSEEQAHELLTSVGL